MKLRIAGHSLRLRVSQSDLARLMQSGRIEETIHFAADAGAQFSYAVEQSESQSDISIRYLPKEVTVVLSTGTARDWAEGDRVGIYGSVNVGKYELTLIVEKDFACLDGSDQNNIDTFPNPRGGITC